MMFLALTLSAAAALAISGDPRASDESGKACAAPPTAITDRSAPRTRQRLVGAWRGALPGLGSCRADIADVNGKLRIRWPGNSSGPIGEDHWYDVVPDANAPDRFVVVREDAHMIVTTTLTILETGELEEVEERAPKQNTSGSRGSWRRAPYRYVCDASAMTAIAMLEGDHEQRLRAAEMLAHIGAPAGLPAVPRLVQLIGSNEPPCPSDRSVRLRAAAAVMMITPTDIEALAAIVRCADDASEPQFLRYALRAASRLAKVHAAPAIMTSAKATLVRCLRTREMHLDVKTASQEARDIAAVLQEIADGDPATLSATAPLSLVRASDAARERDAYESLTNFRIEKIYADAVEFSANGLPVGEQPVGVVQVLRVGESIERGGLTFQFVRVGWGEIVLATRGRPFKPTPEELSRLSPEGQAVVLEALERRGDAEIEVHHVTGGCW